LDSNKQKGALANLARRCVEAMIGNCSGLLGLVNFFRLRAGRAKNIVTSAGL